MRTIDVVVLAMLAALATSAAADTIAIIGTGNVAKALGPEFAAQGYTIVYGSREPERPSVRELVEATGNDASATTPRESVIDAGMVVLAVPGMMVGEITRSLGDLSGKIVIDPTNPLQRSGLTFRHAADTSNAEIIQSAAPAAEVVKAFNTLNWAIMVEPSAAGGPVSIPLVGNSSAAKRSVATLVEGMGLHPIDMGGLDNARWVEGMAILLLDNRVGSRESFNFYLRPSP